MAGSYETTFHGLLNDVPVQNSFYWSTPETDNTFTVCLDAGSSLASAGVISAFLDVVNDQYLLEAIHTRGIAAAGGGTIHTPTAVYDCGLAAGTRTGGVLSNQDGPLISYFATSMAGERARVNKIFIPGISEADGGEDLVGSPLTAALNTFLVNLGVPVPTSTTIMTWKALVKIAAAKTLRSIVGASVERFIATQRRRKPKGI